MTSRGYDSPVPESLGLRKADNAALLTTFLDPGDPPKARLSQDQLKQVGAIAISRF
jgi:hypothetical protein